MLVFALLAALTCGITACGESDGPGVVVVYTSVDEVFARPIAEQFTRETGIEAQAAEAAERLLRKAGETGPAENYFGALLAAFEAGD